MTIRYWYLLISDHRYREKICVIFLLKKVMATIEVGIDTVDGSSDRGVKITTAVVVTCIVAASGGLIFGYDIGISGIFSIQLMLRNS